MNAENDAMLAIALAFLSGLSPQDSGWPANGWTERFEAWEHEREPEESYVALREGIVGGIAGPRVERELVLGYAWSSGEFLAARRTKKSELNPFVYDYTYERCVLSRDQFVDLIESVHNMGIAELPLEEPAGGQDIYRLDTGLTFHYRDVVWRNRAPGGCLHYDSAVQPSAEQRARFQEIVALLWGRADELPWVQGGKGDLERPLRIEATEFLWAFRIARTRAGAYPFADRLDYGQLQFSRLPRDGDPHRIEVSIPPYGATFFLDDEGHRIREHGLSQLKPEEKRVERYSGSFRLQGQIVDENGQPLQEAEVRIGHLTVAETDELGRINGPVSREGLVGREHTLVVTAPGRVKDERKIDIRVRSVLLGRVCLVSEGSRGESE